MSTSFSPRSYVKRFQLANQIVVHQNPNVPTGTYPFFAGQAIQAKVLGNLVYVIPWTIVSGVQEGYIYSYNLDTKKFSGYTQIPDCTVTWGIEIVGTDIYVASKSLSLNKPAYFKSTDGGNTWTSFIFSEPANPIVVIRAIKFSPFNSLNGIVFGVESSGTANAWYSRTSDGGTTWSAWTQLTTIRGVYDIAYLDANKIIISGINSSNVGITRTSTDGGVTWGSNLVFTGTYICNGMSWLDSQVGYIASRTASNITAGAGRLYMTKDGGASWTLITIPSNIKSVQSIYAFSRSLIVMNVYDSINTRTIMFVTRDGGLTWTQIISSTFNSSQYIIKKDNSLFTVGRGIILFELKVSY